MDKLLVTQWKPYDCEVEYLESTGTQFVDTGIVPLVTDYVYCEYMYVSPLNTSDGSGALFGVFEGWANKAFALVLSPGKTTNNTYFLRGNAESHTTVYPLTPYCDVWQNFTIDSTTATFLGNTFTNTNSNTCAYTAYIFAAHNGSNQQNPAYGLGSTKRIRRFQYKRGGAYLLDLIPVRIGTVGYFYDKISGKLFGNAGTGSFVLGQDRNTTKINAIVIKNKPYDAEIEYIESTGTQYIDTLVIPTANTVMRYRFMNLQVTGNVILGYTNGNDQQDFRMFNYNSQIYFDGIGGVRINGSSLTTGDVRYLEMYNYGVKDLTNDTVLISGAQYTGTANGTITINGTANCSKNRSYALQIYESGVLIRDYVPVRIRTTGYLYDKVSGQLFGNAGTGSFTLGPDVESYKPVALVVEDN